MVIYFTMLENKVSEYNTLKRKYNTITVEMPNLKHFHILYKIQGLNLSLFMET